MMEYEPIVKCTCDFSSLQLITNLDDGFSGLSSGWSLYRYIAAFILTDCTAEFISTIRDDYPKKAIMTFGVMPPDNTLVHASARILNIASTMVRFVE